MNDSLIKLLQYIEPKILNIQDVRLEVKSLKEVRETLNELIDLGENHYQDILNFYDQDFIIRTIKISQDENINKIDDYKRSKYLLKSNDSNLKELPQYKMAISYMEKLFAYLVNLNHQINIQYDNIKNDLDELEIFNKYSIILQKNNIFIEDVEEFLLFLKLVDIPDDDKLKILMLITEYNVRNYTTTNDVLLTNNLYLSNIIDVLDKYQYLIKQENDVNQDYEINSKKLFEEFGKEGLIRKKNYFVNRLSKLYDEKEYDKLIDYYENIKLIEIYEKEIQKQEIFYNEEYSKGIIFLRKDNELVIKEFLDSCLVKYKGCIYKNLFDIESSKDLILPNYIIEGLPIYLKTEFLVQTVYMFLNDGLVLVLGALDVRQDLFEFIHSNMTNIKKMIRESSNYKNINERDILLKDINVEDLILTIDVDTLNMNGG